MTGPRTSVRKGVLLGIGAYGMWGLFPLYFPLLEPATPVEILGHRVVWTLVFLLVVLLVRRRWAWVRAIVHDRRRLTILTVASTVIAVNWGVYIWAVNNDRVVEAALGYFINPLVTVLLGVLVLHERLRVGQWVAVGLAAVAVLVLTAAYGRPPWIALTLALSFATYGLMKNRVRMPAVESLSVETTLLVVPALAVLVWLQVKGTATFGHASGATTTLLAMAGVITAVPLLMFAGAASRVPLSTLGLLQYITPILQFLIGVLVVHEVMPPARWVGFGLVWAALVLFSVDSLRAARASAAADPLVSPTALDEGSTSTAPAGR
jgi:chloramphenicol-sensitive protein RarD